MTIVFLSNYFNHHQAPFSEAMRHLVREGYVFIATEPVEEERVQMGWMSGGFPQYVYQYTKNKELCDRLIDDADIVIKGAAPNKIIKNRLKRKKIILVYSERIDKTSPNLLSFIKSYFRLHLNYLNEKNVYCLSASAYTTYDFSKRFLFKDKCYKWGYFPKTISYGNIANVISWKHTEDVSILFVSRLIGWKHPELPIQVAKKLKTEGIKFHLTIIGIGEMEEQLYRMIDENCLENEITHLRSMPPEDVRKYMEKSAIFLFTSDKNEGWGAVLNESMNSGCAVVASSDIGSVPFLLKDGENGYVYRDGNFEDLYAKVRELCINQDKRDSFGIAAYKTIVDMWNAENAAKRLLSLIVDLQKKRNSNRYLEGPCSKAEILKDGWY